MCPLCAEASRDGGPTTLPPHHGRRLTEQRNPRSRGIDRAGVAEALAELAPPRLIYLSCDPATLARDLVRLAPHYRVSEIELFDLFPQTFHIEALARLERTA